jgi:hypothetical protein
LEETFETDGEGVRYTVFGAGEALSRSYFHRREGDHIFEASDGLWFFGGENIDGQPGHVGYNDGDSSLANAGKGAVVFEPVSIAGFVSLDVVLSVAASDPGGFDVSNADGDKLSVEVSIDEGPFEKIAQFKSTQSNGPMIAPGNLEVTNEFTDWSFPFEVMGETLQLRIVVRSTSGVGNEVVAFDRVGLIGREDVLPEDLLPLGGACNPIF